MLPSLRRAALRHAMHRCRFSSDLPYNVIDGSMHLRVPSGAVTGTPSDVATHLPLLHELSVGARRGTPRWVDKAAAAPAAGKKRSESWLEITYPFSTDAELREQYMLGDGLSLRAGRFLEELDAFSADCALRHARVGDHPISVVTAAHDGLSIFEGLSAVHDFRLRGVVTSVGSSSMEVQTDVLQVEPDGKGEVIIGSCYTVMAARHTATFKAATVPQLIGGSSTSAAVEVEALRRKQRRRALAESALVIKPPTPKEVPLLHALWQQSHARVYASSRAGTPITAPRVPITAPQVPARVPMGASEMPITAPRVPITAPARVPMGASEMRTLDIMQPANRNMNGYIFGGFLMRRALEIAWLSAHKHCGRAARFGGLDDVVFSKPVLIALIASDCV